MMNKVMYRFYEALLLTMFILFFAIGKNIVFSIFSVVASFLLIVFFQKIFRKIFQFIDKSNQKYDRIYLCVILILYMILFVIFNIKKILDFDLSMKIVGLNFLVLLLTNLLIFHFCKRKSGRKYAYLSSVLSIAFLPVLFHFYKMSINFSTILFPIGILYLFEGFDFSAFLRKKNLIRIFVFYVFFVVFTFFNELSILLLIYLFFSFTKKCGSFKQRLFSIMLFSCPLIFYIVYSILYFAEFDNNLIINFSSLVLISILLFDFVYICKNYYVQKEINKKIILEFIYICFAIFIVKDFTYLFAIVPIIIVYISLTSKIYLVVCFNLSKYFVPKNIKKVSAIIPNYNYANYIVDRIDSVLKQNYPVYELIILDDASSDNSEQVILDKIEKVKNEKPELSIKYIPNEKNSGNVFKQWAKCFEVAEGDYVWICEADDLCSKYFLNTVMRGFNDQDVILSYSESLAIDENDKVFKKNLRDWIDIYNTGKWNENYIANGVDELDSTLCINNTIANVSGVVFKNDKNIDFKTYLKKAQDFVLAGDWYFYSKVLLHGKIAYFKDSLNYHRMHSGSVTNTTDNFIHYKEVEFIQNSISSDIKISKNTCDLMKDRLQNLKLNFCISDDELYYDKISLDDLIKSKNINDDVLLSVIIPVYNVEQYIGKCLKSVFKALPDKTEVIVINDGSPDNSEKIILDFKKKYKNLKYIKKENGGLSSVKNRGLKEAKGRYVIFLDSDDYISSNMHSTMLKKAIDKDSDFVYCDVLMVFEDGGVKYCNMTNYSRENKIMQILDNNLMAASWNKMIKRELYDGLSFPEGINNEDVAVSPSLMLRAKNIQKVESPFYKYLQRSGSIQNSGFNEKRFMVFDTTKICFDLIKKYSYVEREMVEGAIVTNQLLALLIWPIAELKDVTYRKKMIEIFCKRFNDLGINNNNHYVIEYLQGLNKLSLLEYIENNNYEKIDSLIKG